MKLKTDREKAAFLVGMVRAFESGQWPEYFNTDDRSVWTRRALIAEQILNGVVVTTSQLWQMRDLADNELKGEV